MLLRDLVLQSRTLSQNLLVSRAIVFLRNTNEWRPVLPVIVRWIFRQVVEERGEPVKILPRDGIELVIVANCTSRSETEKRCAKRLCTFSLVVHAQLFDKRSALTRTDADSQKCRSDQRIQVFRGQHVSRDLFLHELIKRLVLVEGLDHVVAIRPNAAEIIQVQSVSVAVARDIQPVVGAMLAVPRTCQ